MIRKSVFFIFLVLISCLIAASVITKEAAQRIFYHAVWFKVLWVVISAYLIAATVKLAKERSFSFSVICLGFLFILAGGFTTSFLEEEGFMEIAEGQTIERFWIEDDLSRPLGFSLTLKDFSVDFYPRHKEGMNFIKSYKTSVSIHNNDKLLEEAVIEVNKPLSFKGLDFYQYGYDAKLPDQTILQVVRDPGLPFVYAGYIILLVGMVFAFKRIFFYI